MNFSEEEIAFFVHRASGVSYDDMRHGNTNRNLYPRYCAIMLMFEERMEKARIARFFGIDRSLVNKALDNADNLLQFDKAFKRLYFDSLMHLNRVEEDTPYRKTYTDEEYHKVKRQRITGALRPARRRVA
jgi:hypothetical protein